MAPRPSVLTRQQQKMADSTARSAEDIAKDEQLRNKGWNRLLKSKTAPNPLQSAVDTVKGWLSKPKSKPAAPARAPASPFPALTNAQRDSLSKKYLGK
jgi:hypothetical protein